MNKLIPYFIGAVALLGIVFWIIINPTSMPVQLERGPITKIDNFYFGPYPTEEEFIRLKQSGVQRIISLLDDRIFYEKILLEREKDIAKRYKIELVNYPMGSLFAKQLFTDYESVAKKAVDDAMLHQNKVTYIHCYLGKHRTQYVRNEILKRKGQVPEPMPFLSEEDKSKVQQLEKSSGSVK